MAVNNEIGEVEQNEGKNSPNKRGMKKRFLLCLVVSFILCMLIQLMVSVFQKLDSRLLNSMVENFLQQYGSLYNSNVTFPSQF